MLSTWFLRINYLNSNLRNCIYFSVWGKYIFLKSWYASFFPWYWEKSVKVVESKKAFISLLNCHIVFIFGIHHFIKITYLCTLIFILLEKLSEDRCSFSLLRAGDTCVMPCAQQVLAENLSVKCRVRPLTDLRSEKG